MKKDEMRTVDIKGKQYVEVNQRILYFRSNYEQGKILTSIESMENGIVVIRAEIYVNNELVSTGHAYEKEGSTFINKTSYLENCETSAIGRALGIFGIGIDTSIASSEEVSNAIKQQEETKKEKKNTKEEYSSYGNLSEEEATKKANKQGLSNIMRSLEKDENKDFKAIVMKNICDKNKVSKWYDLRYSKELIEEVKKELQNQKDLANAGI